MIKTFAAFNIDSVDDNGNDEICPDAGSADDYADADADADYADDSDDTHADADIPLA